jgi:hypothetical protein
MRIGMLEPPTKTMSLEPLPQFSPSNCNSHRAIAAIQALPYSMPFDAPSTRYCTQCHVHRPVREFRKDTPSQGDQQESEPNVTTHCNDETEPLLAKTCATCREKKRVSRNASRKAKKQRLNEEKWQTCSGTQLRQWIENGYHLGLKTINV